MHMNWWILRRSVHVSWFIAILCISLLVGVALSRNVSFQLVGDYGLIAAGSVLVGVAFWRRFVYIIPLLVIGGIVMGLWRGQLAFGDLSALRQTIGYSVTVHGHVMDDVDSNASGQIALRLDSLTIHSKAIGGTIWATVSTKSDIKRGDFVTLTGKIAVGFGSFAGTMYRAELLKLEQPQPGDLARQFRDWFADAVRRAIPDPQSSLGIGYLVGQKRALPDDLVAALKIAGLTHVVVASGYNLTILVRLARRLFEKISKYLSALASSMMIVGFVSVTGLSPSMSRAGLVAGLSLAAWYYGRRFHPLVLLPFAASVTVLINPSYIWGDLGWQLSFSAFAGVMILAPLLQRYFFGDVKPGIVRQIMGETISATVVTAPILISAFGQISNVSIVANLLVLPLVPLAMLLTFIAGLGSILLSPFATLIALPATWLLGYMVAVAKYLSELSWATSVFSMSGFGVAGCYFLIVSVCVLLWRSTKLNLGESNLVE